MTSKEIFNEVDEILLKSNKPSKDIRRLIENGEFDKEPFEMIKNLEKVEQNLKYHPEGNVLNHILLVVDKASEVKKLSENERVFMWSALLHDLGKLTTTKIRRGKITSYNHDIEGEKIGKVFLDMVSNDKKFNESVSKMIRYHMQPLFYDKNLPFFNPQNMINDVKYKEIALLSFCDRLGRGNLSLETINNEKERIEKFKQYFKTYKG
ncbi:MULTISPECIES: HDIG domain-containing metalloprotein [Romboutsia]|nr:MULTISPECIES: HD domain-containing protein [Romboutsia]MCH1960447.1 HD domain-containing protein [Romboutsia hominis]MCH1969121.1 HD domain-containing protein [Romboutsia hominis]MDB8791643.1 HD domain-containing protein [Romboutsia sp. 1001216sp1]MDB8793385.1 HD domain-containing protein [Romboutsia sp. 1001216sp1]MDB8796812.1 HD domain-containing protein [Romboutsia sp. 1001216sp1]